MQNVQLQAEVTTLKEQLAAQRALTSQGPPSLLSKKQKTHGANCVMDDKQDEYHNEYALLNNGLQFFHSAEQNAVSHKATFDKKRDRDDAAYEEPEESRKKANFDGQSFAC